MGPRFRGLSGSRISGPSGPVLTPKETFKFGHETITGAIVFLEKPGPRRGR